MKTTHRKLKLGKETLRTLGAKELGAAHGGGFWKELWKRMTQNLCPDGGDDDETGVSVGVRA